MVVGKTLALLVLLSWSAVFALDEAMEEELVAAQMQQTQVTEAVHRGNEISKRLFNPNSPLTWNVCACVVRSRENPSHSSRYSFSHCFSHTPGSWLLWTQLTCLPSAEQCHVFEQLLRRSRQEAFTKMLHRGELVSFFGENLFPSL